MRYWILIALMLCSGLAGISYEVLYARLLGNLIGDQFIVSASILMTFLLGIGWGSLLAHRFWRYLWLIEAGIAIYALLMVSAMPWLEVLLYADTSLMPDGLLGSVIFGVLLLLIPALLIGCSVPIFSSWLAKLRHHQQDAFSLVYMIYNVGAVITALAIEFWLIRWLGIQQTVVFFASINILVAIILRLVYAQMAGQAPLSCDGVMRPLLALKREQILPLLAASVGSAILQLFMMKYAEMVFGPFRESFALVLSIVLLGIVVGAWLVPRLRWSFAWWMALAVLGLIWLLLAAGPAIYVYAALYELIQPWYFAAVFGKWLVLFILMFVVVVAFGAAIPALLLQRDEVGRESGALLFVSACANALGFLLMVLVLHPLLDYGVQLLVVMLLAALAWMLAPTVISWRRTAMVLTSMLVAWGGYHWLWDEDLLYLSYTNYQSVEDLRDARENVSFPDRYKGYQDVFSINWMNGKPYFFINGYISIPLNNSSEKVVGALSSMYAPELDQALVLGLGSGATASTVGLFFDHTDVVEINPVVRENLYRMAQWNYDIEDNSGVSIVVDDAIHDLKTRQQRYSLILNTVTTPLYFSSSKLYTTDFFALVKERLKDDGVYVTWMDSRIGDEGADIILRSMKTQFSHCALLYVKSAYFLLIGSNQPIVAQQGKVVAANPLLRHDLMEKYDIVADWLPYQLLTSEAYRLIADNDGVVNSANRPELEYAMAHLRSKRIDRLKEQLADQMSYEDIATSVGGSLGQAFPADVVQHAAQKIRRTDIYRKLERLAQTTENYSNKVKLAELWRRKVNAEEENSARAWHRYGYQLMQLNRYEEAIPVFRRVLSLYPRNNDSHFNLGVSLEHTGQVEEAAAAYAAELAVDPDDIDALYRWGRMLWRKGDYRAAHEIFVSALRFSDVPRNLYYYDALSLRALGKVVQAKRQMAIYLAEGGLPKSSMAMLSGF